MAQIKYILYAFLLLVVGFVGISAVQKIASTKTVETKTYSFACGTIRPQEENLMAAKIFKQNCSSCHALDKVLSGPALRGASTRGPWAEDKENFRKWVRNPMKFISTTNYTINLQKQYGAIMPAFPLLTDQDIDSLYSYFSRE